MHERESEYHMPEWLLGRDEMVEACAARDIGAVFRLARRHTGCYNSRLARLCGLTPSRVGEYISGRSHAQQQQVIERVADGLGIPGRMLGLAPRPWEAAGSPYAPAPRGPRTAGETGVRLPDTGGHAGDPPAHDTALADAFDVGFGETAEKVVELSTEVGLDIAVGGHARVLYRHVLLNLGERPMARFARQLWFEQTSGRISLVPVPPHAAGTVPTHSVTIRRVHETETFLKFACLITPPLAPRESLVVQYLCTGGLFVDEHYWRQDIVRPTKQLQLTVRQLGVAKLRGCDLLEEQADGREAPSSSGVAWTHREDGTVLITCCRSDLHAPRALTLRWDVETTRQQATSDRLVRPVRGSDGVPIGTANHR
ncbi:hypothetical protein [Yinghuangia sp. YIM S09857]|uniref:hypothetical protein n=1 Tax=Yinghuangia sp. YIM S09857 TaxID=3436929 RepID=UPI003F52EE68